MRKPILLLTLILTFAVGNIEAQQTAKVGEYLTNQITTAISTFFTYRANQDSGLYTWSIESNNIKFSDLVFVTNKFVDAYDDVSFIKQWGAIKGGNGCLLNLYDKYVYVIFVFNDGTIIAGIKQHGDFR